MVQLNPQASAYYTEQAVSQLPRLLSQIDRDSHSATYGCFDRDHWSWKFRDFPLGMAQSAVYPLALLWSQPLSGNPYYQSPRVLEWIVASMEFTLARQHSNGAFDAFSPNEQDGGTTLGVLHGILEANRLLTENLPGYLCRRVKAAAEKAVAFTLDYDEDHGFISNHRALFAIAFLDAYDLLGDQRCRRRADAWIDSILERQSADGWYLEYEGPDPGYESLGISHLAAYWQRTLSSRLLDSLRRAVEFYSWCVHPDGSVGGVYGSRQTALYFPAGFEILAGEIPMAAAVAHFFRQRLRLSNVVTPATADHENLTPVLYSYLEAALTPKSATGPLPELPCESFVGLREFADSSIAVKASPRYYFIWNAAKGGACRAFDRVSGRLVYEDAGYLVRAGGRIWTSQTIGLGSRSQAESGCDLSATTRMAEFRQPLLTPARFLVLRLLNLTLFRSPKWGRWLRRLIAQQLITSKRPGPLTLWRSVSFDPEQIRFRDRIALSRPLRVEQVNVPRSLLAMHMGSARYFHSSDLECTPQPVTTGLVLDLNQRRLAELEISIRFSSTLESDLTKTNAEVTRL